LFFFSPLYLLAKIEYKHLKPKQQEIYNFQKISGLLAEYGFNCIKLADDWQGADFLAYHKDGKETLKVQLKGRLTIDKKYQSQNIYIAFPINSDWYLVEHDKLVNLAQQHTSWLNTQAWIKNNCYHSKNPNKQLLNVLAQFKLN
jgi:hypothetical protein